MLHVLRTCQNGRSFQWPWRPSIRCKQLAPNLLPDKEKKRIETIVRKKSLEALRLGKLPPWKELELISALDLGTVPWDQVPLELKKGLRPDLGVDSLSLDGTIAVQAKDYNNKTVPLSALWGFYYMCRAVLKDRVTRMVVATNETTRLPSLWQFSGAEHRIYTREDIDFWRHVAKQGQPDHKEHFREKRADLLRWDHQTECLKSCQIFMTNEAPKDFFVQMATGAGKSLVMLDLLAQLGDGQRACIIVPTLDLMEQIAELLEESLTADISRVGTGFLPHLDANIFVCVQNSAWKLFGLRFDLLILDEAHHYEPSTCPHVENGAGSSRSFVQEILSLDAPKRIFFSATLRRNRPDFDFGLRPAVEAGVIKDYTVLVPLITEGDPRPSLVKLIEELPLRRKILAFCNTVREAEAFTHMLSAAGITADHYNSTTRPAQRREMLNNFQQGDARVLVTVDVISEGVDLPAADTCLFVEPRQGIRLQQCVGRVLRNHPDKVDALVIAPPVVQKDDGGLVEDAQLRRLVNELAALDPVFRESLASGGSARGRVSVAAPRDGEVPNSVLEEAARLVELKVFRDVLDTWRRSDPWEMAFEELLHYKSVHGHVLVPEKHRTASGFNLGNWVQNQRRRKRNGTLCQEWIGRLERIGFVWEVRLAWGGGLGWDLGFQELQSFKAEREHPLVPRRHVTKSGFKLGEWVHNRRSALHMGKLSPDKIRLLDMLGFVWKPKVGRPPSGKRGHSR